MPAITMFLQNSPKPAYALCYCFAKVLPQGNNFSCVLLLSIQISVCYKGTTTINVF